MKFAHVKLLVKPSLFAGAISLFVLPYHLRHLHLHHDYMILICLMCLPITMIFIFCFNTRSICNKLHDFAVLLSIITTESQLHTEISDLTILFFAPN